jgi:bacterioferritin-associated ferredoxin
VYVCICERVRESEVRSAIRCGARCEETVGDACGAGTGCGSCLDRISELIAEENALDLQPAQASGSRTLEVAKPLVGLPVPVGLSRLPVLRQPDTLSAIAA